MESTRLALIASVLTVSLALPLGPRDVALTGAEPLDGRLEVARLRSHFDSVDAELRHSNALQLTPAQRTVRVTLIGWLRDYREAGRFPRNDRFPNQAMPFFRDSRGVLCAMAYLIERSARGDIVDRIASTRNNAFIPSWLVTASFSLGWIAPASRWQRRPAFSRGIMDRPLRRTTK